MSRVAARLAIPVVGTLGLIARAKAAGVITAARPLIEAIAKNGMFMAQIVMEDFFHRLGE